MYSSVYLHPQLCKQNCLKLKKHDINTINPIQRQLDIYIKNYKEHVIFLEKQERKFRKFSSYYKHSQRC